MAALLFSLASAADVPALADLAARSDPYAWSASQILSSIDAQANATLAAQSFVFLCRDASTHALAGFAAFQSVLDEAELLYVLVDRLRQGHGIGHSLLRYGLQQLASTGVQQCFLEVRKSNVMAQKLYLAVGFAVVGERKAYYANGQNGREDALLMRCEITKELA